VFGLLIAEERVQDIVGDLGALPTLGQAVFADRRAELLRTLTRVATHTNEEALIDSARAMTASHLERVVRTYRQIPYEETGDDGDKKETVEQRRRLDYRWTADAMFEIPALLPAEEGALVLSALRRAADHLFRHSAHRASSTDPMARQSPTPRFR
jgi:hypothetical protein